jgi:hypothetical protein
MWPFKEHKVPSLYTLNLAKVIHIERQNYALLQASHEILKCVGEIELMFTNQQCCYKKYRHVIEHLTRDFDFDVIRDGEHAQYLCDIKKHIDKKEEKV